MTLIIYHVGQFAVTMIHDGLMRDVMKPKGRQEVQFCRRIGGLVKSILPPKKKRHIVISDDENSPMSQGSAKDSSPGDILIIEAGSDTCALCEGLAKVHNLSSCSCCCCCCINAVSTGHVCRWISLLQLLLRAGYRCQDDGRIIFRECHSFRIVLFFDEHMCDLPDIRRGNRVFVLHHP